MRFLRRFLLLGFVTAGVLAIHARTDVVIYGATPAGIATAVRAAREGLTVAIVSYDRHIGGMPSNGLGLFDTGYEGARAPLFEEIVHDIGSHYPPGDKHAGPYEAHVAEAEFESLLAREKNISLLREFYPVAAQHAGRRLAAVTFRQMGGTAERSLAADAFVDASYEGDLAKVAGAQMITGRESRDQYGEAHAGVIFTKLEPTPPLPPGQKINLTLFPLMANTPLAGSTGAGDQAIQAFNFRVCLTRDPANRVAVQKPQRYERDIYLLLRDRWKFTSKLPNQKTSWNAPILVGGNFDYPEGDWPARQAIAARHKDLALGLLWFLQHDDAVPETIRREAREWGLPRDEFVDNGGFPWEVYVREARRLVGRYVFTEHDALPAPGMNRAPVHPDSIAITEWPLDSHACHVGPDGVEEGKVLLSLETRPGQIPYRTLLPKEIDNLLVTGCVSSSHIGWGSIRLEPTWIHLGESAGYALARAKALRLDPAALPVDDLVRTLVRHGIMVTFFNDFDLAKPTPEQKAAQFLGTRGFFASYEARLEAPLSAAVAAIWIHPPGDPATTAKAVAEAERATSLPITTDAFSRLSGRPWPGPAGEVVSRGAACAALAAIDL